MAEPLDCGSLQLTVTDPVPGVTAKPVGASGALAGTMAEVGIETTEDSAMLFAVELVTALNV